MNSRLEAYSRKLEESLSSHHRFPINLEWLVDLFKYKHISSLTTHLKRHFNERTDYKRIPEGQNKRTWSYHITIDCFSRICHYCRHSERKIVAKYWLRKILLTRRDNISPNASPSSSCSASDEERDEEDEAEEDEDDDEEMEDADEETNESNEETNEEESTPEESTSPENSPRSGYSSGSGSSSPLNSSSVIVQMPHPQVEFQHPLDWSYLKLRSYDVASLYHLSNMHHNFHCYISPSSHQNYSSSPACCQLSHQHQAISLSNHNAHEFFRPSSPTSPLHDEHINEPSSYFDTNAFLSIPDDADDEASPRGRDSDTCMN